jgi:hypothetical protein
LEKGPVGSWQVIAAGDPTYLDQAGIQQLESVLSGLTVEQQLQLRCLLALGFDLATVLQVLHAMQ